ACRSCECAAFMTEDLAFHQVLWKRAAIYRNERTVRTRTEVMNGARKKFFARTRLAGDEHSGVASREPRHTPYFFQKLWALADNLFEPDILLESFYESAAAEADARLTLKTWHHLGRSQRRQKQIRRARL